ncbi:MAG: small multi-drug export protein [Clostridiales bacterium]|nr:small multi-drug export protein [Clostridiales bacterium]
MTVTLFKNILWVFFISALPFVELRGAIPVGAALGLDWHLSFILSVLGNMLPVPFILIFMKRVIKWMKSTKKLKGIAERIENHTLKKSKLVGNIEAAGLIILIAIPLPGTGAWTGAMTALLLNMKLRYAVFCILIGVILAGIIVTGITYGFAALIS